MSDDLAVVGKRLPRVDALAKVKGETTFIPDIQLPGMLYAKFLRSPHAHARILKINTAAAERLRGVSAVLTYQNVPQIHPARKLEYLLCETMHYAGDEVAVVAAESRDIAQEALRLIDVEYEVLPAVFDAEEAMQAAAPLVHSELASNVFRGQPQVTPDGWLVVNIGDVNHGFTEADFIIENVYESPMQYTCSPMPRAVVCQWTGNKLTCWADTQSPQNVWFDLARCLNIPQSDVRLIVHCVGSYGHKIPEKVSVIAALLAKRTGRPVKIELTREEDFINVPRRLNYKAYAKLGVKQDGTITAVSNRVISNCGNDAPMSFMVLATSGTKSFIITYRSKNVRFEGCTVLTNTTHHGAVLGFGDPEANYCIDRLIDEAAEKVAMDPVEFRILNCVRYGDKCYDRNRLVSGKDPQFGIVGKDLDMQLCLHKVAEMADWHSKWRGWTTPMAIVGSKRRGIGVASGIHHCNYSPYSALVRMNQDGTANVLSSAVEIGQGCATAIIQVVAESLGLHYQDVNATLADTGATPLGPGNMGSMGTSSAVTAAKYAADDAKRQILEIAAKELRVKVDDLSIKDGNIFITKQLEKKITIATACQKGYQIIGVGVNPPADTIKDADTGEVLQHYAAAAVIAEVEVDTETGELNVLRISSANDCGKAINPTIVENQIDLGITMGNGWIRSEDFVIDPSTGVMLNPNLLDYKLMTCLDVPGRSNTKTSIIELPCAWGPYGAKGFSETAMVAVAPAIANAIYNAIGVRLRGEHVTPESILKALREVRQ